MAFGYEPNVRAIFAKPTAGNVDQERPNPVHICARVFRGPLLYIVPLQLEMKKATHGPDLGLRKNVLSLDAEMLGGSPKVSVIGITIGKPDSAAVARWIASVARAGTHSEAVFDRHVECG